ncbi:MAG: hypothetical protein GXY17_00975 [Clostridiaceae bacterium]|nr:hypothetical protein [Clostridiaceae bacterium]
MRSSKASKIISTIVFLSLVFSIIYVIIRIIMVPGGVQIEGERPESEYVLMLVQCTLGVFIMFLPGIISRRFSIQIPSNMYIMFVLFLYCAIYLGEVQSFYYQIEHWDALLHGFSGAMLGALGFSVITLFNKSERVPIYLSPAFVALFSFCFAIMLGVLWEIYEYVVDGLLGLNMQKFALADGKQLVGRDALSNTMKDFIFNTIGALFMSIAGYISLKYEKGWIDKLLIKKIRLKSSTKTETKVEVKTKIEAKTH